jgi:hypothetical protein
VGTVTSFHTAVRMRTVAFLALHRAAPCYTEGNRRKEAL